MAEESGLLGILNDPNMVGLLSAAASGMAGARRGAPWNTAGAALLGGLQGYSGAQSNLIDVAQKKAQLDWAKQIGGGMSQPSGAQSMASLSSQPSIVDSKDTPAWAQQKTAQLPPQQRSAGVSLPMLMQGAALGMKNMEPLFNMYKYANDGVERKTNTVYVNPITGEKTYIGDPSKGYNMNPNTGEVSPMSGFIATNNAIKGGEADATEQAKARYNLADPQKTPWINGRPFAGTQLQAAQLLNGANGQTSTAQQNQIPMAIQARLQYANSIKDPQEKQSFINAVYSEIGNTPQREQLGAAWTAALSGKSIPAQPAASAPQAAASGTPSGLYFPTPAELEAEKAMAVSPIEVNKTIATERGKRVEQADFNLPKVVATAENAIANVDAIMNHPGKKTALGVSGYVDPRNYIPGTDAMDFKQRMGQLEGQVFLQAFESLKGGGQITEVEGKKAQNALVRASRAQSQRAFDEAMSEYKGIIQRGASVAKQQAAGQSSAVPSQSVDSLLKKYGY